LWSWADTRSFPVEDDELISKCLINDRCVLGLVNQDDSGEDTDEDRRSEHQAGMPPPELVESFVQGICH
jgi:hypothetical protein